MSISELSRAIGVPPKWRRATWPLFEKCVLGLIAEGCKLLQTDSRRCDHWQERHYSWALLGHIEHVCRRKNLAFVPSDERRLLSDEDFATGADPQEAPRIDLVIRWHNLTPAVYYGIEAKVLVGQRVGSYRPWDTVNEYVAEGMERYVRGSYAQGLPSAAMVAYVLSGSAGDLVLKINKRVRSLPLPHSKLLGLVKNGQALPNHYDSAHPRLTGDSIRLHHLLVIFH